MARIATPSVSPGVPVRWQPNLLKDLDFTALHAQMTGSVVQFEMVINYRPTHHCRKAIHDRRDGAQAWSKRTRSTIFLALSQNFWRCESTEENLKSMLGTVELQGRPKRVSENTLRSDTGAYRTYRARTVRFATAPFNTRRKHLSGSVAHTPYH